MIFVVLRASSVVLCVITQPKSDVYLLNYIFVEPKKPTINIGPRSSVFGRVVIQRATKEARRTTEIRDSDNDHFYFRLPSSVLGLMTRRATKIIPAGNDQRISFLTSSVFGLPSNYTKCHKGGTKGHRDLSPLVRIISAHHFFGLRSSVVHPKKQIHEHPLLPSPHRSGRHHRSK